MGDTRILSARENQPPVLKFRLEYGGIPMDKCFAAYLRKRAQELTTLARNCTHQPTSQDLQGIAVELMEKALQIEHANSIGPEPHGA